VKQLILLIQTQADVEALPAAARVIQSERYEAAWVLLSPAVLVDTKAAESSHQKDISDLEAAIERCARARDWDGCRAYQTQLDAAKLKKVVEVGEAWKSLTADQKKIAGDKLIQSFGQPCPNIQFQPLPDHYEPRNFIDALNSIRKNWHAPCVPPSFVLTWASTLAANAGVASAPLPAVALMAIQQPPAGASTNTPPPAPKSGGNPMFSDPRYRELGAMTIDQLGELALRLKLTVAGNAAKIRATIWKHERSLKAAA
jgi:hypothetical protein